MTPQKPPKEGQQDWLSGVVVIVAVTVSYIGFARVSVGWTLAISTVILIGLVGFLWYVGGKKRR